MKTRVSLRYFVNYCRWRGIKKGMINVDNYADGLASTHVTAIVKKY